MLKKILFFVIISVNLFCYSSKKINRDLDKLFEIVPRYYTVVSNDYYFEIDMKYLLQMTAMCESSYGLNNYEGRIAKTYMQAEETTSNHYLGVVPFKKEVIEKVLSRDLNVKKDEDAVFVAYLIYWSKLNYHRNWINLYKDKIDFNDKHWFIYKLYWNSVEGKATKKQWERRKKELEIFT